MSKNNNYLLHEEFLKYEDQDIGITCISSDLFKTQTFDSFLAAYFFHTLPVWLHLTKGWRVNWSRDKG